MKPPESPKPSAERYTTVTEVTRGPLGGLYVAVDKVEQRVVYARKVTGLGKLTESELDSLTEAAWWMSGLSDPLILEPRDVPVQDGSVMPIARYTPAESLHSLLRTASTRSSPVPIRIVLSILSDILQGAIAIEHHGAPASLGSGLFGGLSPDSILIGTDGCARLADVGVAAVARRMERFVTVADVTAYSAPEQLASKATVDVRSDVFAIGVMGWEMLGNHRLLLGSRSERLASPDKPLAIPKLADFRASGWEPVPPELEALVRKALRADPDQRHASTREMLTELQQALGSEVAPRTEVVALVAEMAGKAVASRDGAVRHKYPEALVDVEPSSPVAAPPPVQHTTPRPAAAAPPPAQHTTPKPAVAAPPTEGADSQLARPKPPAKPKAAGGDQGSRLPSRSERPPKPPSATSGQKSVVPRRERSVVPRPQSRDSHLPHPARPEGAAAETAEPQLPKLRRPPVPLAPRPPGHGSTPPRSQPPVAPTEEPLEEVAAIAVDEVEPGPSESGLPISSIPLATLERDSLQPPGSEPAKAGGLAEPTRVSKVERPLADSDRSGSGGFALDPALGKPTELMLLTADEATKTAGRSESTTPTPAGSSSGFDVDRPVPAATVEPAEPLGVKETAGHGPELKKPISAWPPRKLWVVGGAAAALVVVLLLILTTTGSKKHVSSPARAAVATSTANSLPPDREPPPKPAEPAPAPSAAPIPVASAPSDSTPPKDDATQTEPAPAAKPDAVSVQPAARSNRSSTTSRASRRSAPERPSIGGRYVPSGI